MTKIDSISILEKNTIYFYFANSEKIDFCEIKAYYFIWGDRIENH